MKNKKILICASRISHIINFHLPYIEYFRNKNYRVDIAVEGKTDNSMIDNCYDMKFTKNPFSPDNLKTIRLLKKIMSENDYDIIYSNSTLAGAASRMAVKNLKNKPYFVHISHGYMFGENGGLKSKLYLLAEKLTAKVTDSLVVMNSEDLALAEKYHLAKNIHYINGMGLIPENFPEISDTEKITIRKNLGVSDDMKTDDVQNSPASETDRMIFFAGPWISKNKTPDKKLNLYITTDEFRDYYTTPVK